jgi:hypothetical protein
MAWKFNPFGEGFQGNGLPVLVPPLVGIPGLAKPAGASYDADTQTYFDARPSLSGSEKKAINAFVVGLKADGVWDDLTQVGLLTGGAFSDLFAASIKGPAPTNHNFVSGDFSNTPGNAGLVGDGNTKYVDTNVSNDDITVNDAHASIYLSTGCGNAMGDIVFGRDGAAVMGVFAAYQGNTYAFSGNGFASKAYDSAAGFWISSRISSTRIDLYNNGASVANSTGSNSGSLQAGETGTLFAIRNGSLTSYSNRRAALWTVGNGLDSAQCTALNGRVQTLLSGLAGAGGGNYTGNYVLPFFLSDASVGGEVLLMAQSNDGVSWDHLTCTFTPTQGTVRDPCMLLKGTTAYIAYTSGGFNNASTFGIAKGDIHRRIFSTILNVDCSAISGINRCWGPKWFTDPADGSDHILFAASTNGTSGPLAIYEIHPTSAAPYDSSTTWSTPTLVTGSDVPTNWIDAFEFTLDSDPGAYYIIYKNEDPDIQELEILRSTSPFSGFTYFKTTAQLGMDHGIEGCSVVNLGSGVYRIFYDAFSAGTGLHYADTTTFAAVGSGTAITITGTTRNGVFLKT